MNTLEKEQLSRAIALIQGDEKLAEKGESLPASIRQLGIGHTLMKYYKESRGIYDALKAEILIFDEKLRPSGESLEPIHLARNVNQLPPQDEIMLMEHLYSFAEEFRKVAKVMA